MANKQTTATPNAERSYKRLYRSTSNEMIGGVCGGLAEYFDMDPSLMRFIFLVLMFVGGMSVFVYIALWVILPEDKDLEKSTEKVVEKNVEQIKTTASDFSQKAKQFSRQHKDRGAFGWVLLFIGVVLLLKNIGVFNFIDSDVFFPLILIAIGIAFLVK